MTINIVRAVELPIDSVQRIAQEASDDGHNMVQRLVDAWLDESNRFNLAGEALYLAIHTPTHTIVGVGGLNIDPYERDAAAVGRVRHVFISPAYRRLGIGNKLMHKIIETSIASFGTLQLRTHDSQADAFYQALGFESTHDPNRPWCTHRMNLK